MRLLRIPLLTAVLAGASFVGVSTPRDAQASVSIAVGYDALVKDADAVGVVTPVETKSVWEEGRIYSYTHVKVDQGVAGELGTGSEGWVRTMGGVVGKIGQLVDGEPVFTVGKSSLVFLRKFKASATSGASGTWEVSARAQGQYPIVVDASVLDPVRARRVMRSGSVGVLFPAKQTAAELAAAAAATAGPPAPPGVTSKSTTTTTVVERPRLASEVLHDRQLDEVAREVAASWKKLHAAPSDTKK